MTVLKPFQLLEINVISAQDLEPVSRKMKTYAIAWVNPKRKLTSRVDNDGHVNPTWNDKFVFRVDDEFLRQDTSAVQIEIYCVNWFRHSLVGSVRVLVGNLIPPPTAHHHQLGNFGMRFAALQVRRPSGRPQGILNIGVALLDSSMRSMPLYTQTASAVGYLDLMAAEDDPNQAEKNDNQAASLKPVLRRSKSERSELIPLDNFSAVNSSIIGIPSKGAVEKDGSILSISFEPPPLVPRADGNKKKGKASSVISGAEIREKPRKGKNGKASSVVSDSIVSKGSSMFRPHRENENKSSRVTGDAEIEEKKEVTINNGKNEKQEMSEIDVPVSTKKIVDEKPLTISKGGTGINPPPKVPKTMPIGKPLPSKYYNPYEYGGPRGKFVPYKKGGSLLSDSEVGPSPSEVAAAIAERRYPLDEERSSVLDGWSLDESVEGLRSKLERWRTELPPIYDTSAGYGSSSFQSTSQYTHTRRRSDGGAATGMFSCFSNIYGYECQCVCGKPSSPTNKKLSSSARYQSPSNGSRSFF